MTTNEQLRSYVVELENAVKENNAALALVRQWRDNNERIDDEIVAASKRAQKFINNAYAILANRKQLLRIYSPTNNNSEHDHATKPAG